MSDQPLPTTAQPGTAMLVAALIANRAVLLARKEADSKVVHPCQSSEVEGTCRSSNLVLGPAPTSRTWQRSSSWLRPYAPPLIHSGYGFLS